MPDCSFCPPKTFTMFKCFFVKSHFLEWNKCMKTKALSLLLFTNYINAFYVETFLHFQWNAISTYLEYLAWFWQIITTWWQHNLIPFQSGVAVTNERGTEGRLDQICPWNPIKCSMSTRNYVLFAFVYSWFGPIFAPLWMSRRKWQVTYFLIQKMSIDTQ